MTDGLEQVAAAPVVRDGSGSPLHRREDPRSSREAALVASRGIAVRHRIAIVSALYLLAQATKDEIAERSGIGDSVAVARRMKSLETEGLVQRLGFVPGNAGRTVTLWGLTEKGREEWSRRQTS